MARKRIDNRDFYKRIACAYAQVESDHELIICRNTGRCVKFDQLRPVAFDWFTERQRCNFDGKTLTDYYKVNIESNMVVTHQSEEYLAEHRAKMLNKVNPF